MGAAEGPSAIQRGMKCTQNGSKIVVYLKGESSLKPPTRIRVWFLLVSNMYPGCNLLDNNLYVLDLTQLRLKDGTQASSIRVDGTKVERTTNCEPEGCFFGLKFTRTCGPQTNKETEFLIIFKREVTSVGF